MKGSCRAPRRDADTNIDGLGFPRRKHPTWLWGQGWYQGLTQGGHAPRKASINDGWVGKAGLSVIDAKY